jgi:hypothetical protein
MVGLRAVLERLEGQLTAAVHLDEADYDAARALMPVLVAWPTSTPVPKPLTKMRPARRSSTGMSARAAS